MVCVSNVFRCTAQGRQDREEHDRTPGAKDNTTIDTLSVESHLKPSLVIGGKTPAPTEA